MPSLEYKVLMKQSKYLLFVIYLLLIFATLLTPVNLISVRKEQTARFIFPIQDTLQEHCISDVYFHH